MLRRSGLYVVAAWICALGNTGALHAQDVRDVVRDHLERELESKPKAKPETKAETKAETKTTPKPRPQQTPEPSASTEPARGRDREPREAHKNNGVHFSIGGEPDAPADKPKGPSLPQRVLGRYLQLDVTVGGGYRGWLPQQFPHVQVGVGSYYVWTVDVKAKLFKLVTLHRGYFESNSLAGPRTEEAAVAAQVGSYIPKAAWILGVLGFPWFKVWEPILRYESRAFHTEARPREPACVVTDEVSADLASCERSREPLHIISGFETFVAGVRYDQGRDPTRDPSKKKLPPITFGVGLLSYRKPYQVNINGNTLNGYLFDGRFRGAGVMLGVDFNGGANELSVSLDAQLGLGEVKLTSDLSLSSLAPEDWLMGYVVGNLSVGYSLPIYPGVPTVMFVPRATLGGASFFFFKTRSDKAEDEAGSSDVASANWDLLWMVHAAVVVSL